MKKVKEVPIEVIDKPSNSFCVGCKNTDLRLMKDANNLMYMMICKIEELLKIKKHSHLKTRCESIIKQIKKVNV
jgi:hypothetical protein